MLRLLTYLVAVVAILIGIVCFSTIPTKLGLYTWLASRNPKLIGLTPAYHHNIPWKFTYEDLDTLDLTGQTAIVTGANSGIGYALTEYLYQLGAEVTMACRNPMRCLAAAETIRSNNANNGSSKKTGTLVTDGTTIDTESLASVKEFATQYLKTTDRPLDMLFLNAGTGFMDPDYKCVPTSVDGVEKLFALNYLGHHLLFRLLEPALQKSKHVARVVSTSSGASFDTYSYKVATDLETLNGCSEPFLNGGKNLSYGQSKLAQILWTKYLTRKYLPSHSPSNNSIYVNAFHPGAAATQIWDTMLVKEAKSPQYVVDLSNWMQREVMWTAREGALTGIFLGAAVNRLVEDQVRGKYFHPQSQEVVNPMALDEELQDRLWEFSEELIKDFLVVVADPVQEEAAAAAKEGEAPDGLEGEVYQPDSELVEEPEQEGEETESVIVDKEETPVEEETGKDGGRDGQRRRRD